MTLAGMFNQDGGCSLLSGDIETSGDTVTFAGAVTLGANVEIDTQIPVALLLELMSHLSSTLDGANTFTVDAGTGGDLVLTGAVGSVTSLVQ